MKSKDDMIKWLKENTTSLNDEDMDLIATVFITTYTVIEEMKCCDNCKHCSNNKPQCGSYDYQTCLIDEDEPEACKYDCTKWERYIRRVK